MSARNGTFAAAVVGFVAAALLSWKWGLWAIGYVPVFVGLSILLSEVTTKMQNMLKDVVGLMVFWTMLGTGCFLLIAAFLQLDWTSR